MLKPPGSLIINLPNVCHLCCASPHHIAIKITEIETVIDTQYAINVNNKNETEWKL